MFSKFLISVFAVVVSLNMVSFASESDEGQKVNAFVANADEEPTKN